MQRKEINLYSLYTRWIKMEFLGGTLLRLKSGALKTTINITRTGFELSVSRSRNAIYFCIIAIPKKSHFLIFAIQNCAKHKKNLWIPFILLESCLLGKWMVFSGLLSSQIRVSTQIMLCNYCTAKCKVFSL